MIHTMPWILVNEACYSRSTSLSQGNPYVFTGKLVKVNVEVKT